MCDEASARRLAETMVGLGTAAGVRTRALLTDMNTPLGRVAGNALEVEQAVALLSNEPDTPGDLRALTLTLAREMLAAAGIDADPERVLLEGRALATWRAMVAAQGGDPDAPLPRATHRQEVRAESSGVVSRLEARSVGVAAWRLGAGRARKEDPVSAGAGVRWLATIGDEVRAGDVVLELYSDDPGRFPGAREALAGALQVTDDLAPQAQRALRSAGGGSVVGAVG